MLNANKMETKGYKRGIAWNLWFRRGTPEHKGRKQVSRLHLQLDLGAVTGRVTALTLLQKGRGRVVRGYPDFFVATICCCFWCMVVIFHHVLQAPSRLARLSLVDLPDQQQFRRIPCSILI